MLKRFTGGGLLEFIAANSDSDANIGDNDNDEICKVNKLSNTKYIEEKEINIIKRKAVIIIVECVFITF